MDFRINLDIFRGPLDLLLYLVRKHEVEITEVSLAKVTQQYVEYLDLLRDLDLNTVGDFLEIASTLTEIKSRMVLPRGGEEEAPIDDSRHDLVRQLLEYKKYRDVASMLEERGREWQQRFPRMANDSPAEVRDAAEAPIHEVELWDLVGAFNKILRRTQQAQGPNIVYDDTPIHVHMARIQARLLQERRLGFSDLFAPGMHKSKLVGIFLAVLELMRHQQVIAEQDALFGEIWLIRNDRSDAPIDSANVDNYDHPKVVPPPSGETSSMPEDESAS